MAKKKKKVVLTPEQRMEAKYHRAIRRMEGAMHMLQAEDRLKMNRQAMRMFKSLGEYQDSKKYFIQCKKRIPNLRNEYRESIYNEGMALKQQAKKSTDYAAAMAVLKKIKMPYKDKDEQIVECEQLCAQARKREKIRSRSLNLLIWALLAAAVCFILYLRTPSAFYHEAKIMMGLHDYERAKNLFLNSEGYQDTEDLLVECYYQRALQNASAGELDKAVRLLQSKVGDYKDALDKKAQFEQEIFAKTKVGNTVVYGDTKWLVTEIQSDRLLLVMKTPEYITASFATEETGFSWEKSTIRNWLNIDFINRSFSEAERENLIITKIQTKPNRTYQTKETSVTEDAVFLLSEQEAEQYEQVLTGDENRYSWWLRTPGADIESAEYVTADGKIISYGNIKTSSDLAVRPAIWVKLTPS